MIKPQSVLIWNQKIKMITLIMESFAFDQLPFKNVKSCD